jgi:hypothetical protein
MTIFAEKNGVLYMRASGKDEENVYYQILLGENDNSPFIQTILIEDILNIKHKPSGFYHRALVPKGAIHTGNGHMYPLRLLLGSHEERQISSARRGTRIPDSGWIQRSKKRIFNALGIDALVDLTPDDEGYRDTQRMLALEYVFEEKEALISAEAWGLIEGTPGIECKGQFDTGYHVRVIPKVKAL